MNKKYKTLANNLFLFFLASFLPKAISFFMVPLYTRELTTADYGTADLLTNTVLLLCPFLTLQIQDAVLRFSMRKDCKKNEVLSIGVRNSLIGLFVLIIGILLVLSLHIINLTVPYVLYIITYYLGLSINSIFTYYCRGTNRVKIVTISSVILTCTTIALNLILLLVLKAGLIGYLIANALGILVSDVFIYFSSGIRKEISLFNVNTKLRHEMIRFSIPMIFSAISWWINNASDRYILSFYHGASINGLYAVASKIPTIVSTLGLVVSRAFSISAIQEINKEDKDGFLGRSYSMISFAGVLSCSLLMIMNIWLSKLLFLNDFFQAWIFVPPLLISVLMNQLSLSCENMFIALNQTKVISTTAILAAGINTILNFALIPYFSAYGAAIATIIGFTVAWIARYIILSRQICLKHSLKKEITSYVFLITQMILAYYGNKFLFLQVLLFVLIFLLYIKDCTTLFFAIMRKLGVKLSNSR